VAQWLPRGSDSRSTVVVCGGGYTDLKQTGKLNVFLYSNKTYRVLGPVGNAHAGPLAHVWPAVTARMCTSMRGRQLVFQRTAVPRQRPLGFLLVIFKLRPSRCRVTPATGERDLGVARLW
jgi:hypothetical protein